VQKDKEGEEKKKKEILLLKK